MATFKRQISMGMPNEYNHVHDEYKKQFFLSVRRGDVDKLKKFVEKDEININILDPWDNSPLYLACLCGHPHVVKYLLSKGAHYDGNIEGQRCFLAALTMEIRDILREYQGSFQVTENKPDTFDDFLQKLYERVPDYDIQVIVEDQVFLSHRCILAVRCPYFCDKFFENGLKSDIEDTLDITDPIFTATSFRGILQYIYTGKLDVYGCDIQKTTKLADYLGYQRLAKVLKIEHEKARQKADEGVSEKDLLVKAYYREFYNTLQKDFSKLIMRYSLMPSNSVAEQSTGNNQRDYFTDVCFDVDGVVFECHKMFFYGRSEFFRTMLIERGDEQPPAYGGYRSMIKLDNVQVLDFVEIMNYLYADQAKIGEENAEAMLILADMYVIPDLKKTCLEELAKTVNSTNALQIYQTAKTLEINKLVHKCISIMAENFNEMNHVPEFHQLLAKELTVLSTGKKFHDIPFFESLQYYIRDGPTSGTDTLATANQKLHTLSQILKNNHGVNESIPTLNMNPSNAAVRKRREEESCIIL